jgi:hypothetical protein
MSLRRIERSAAKGTDASKKSGKNPLGDTVNLCMMTIVETTHNTTATGKRPTVAYSSPMILLNFSFM